ncbi:MAG: YeeE/YedE family protein [Proteobacteria bacterium]|nr:YeeE/YedE family protein [Pseudomonadota bacterium]
MDLTELIERIGERHVTALGGLAIGLLFGIFAQRSRFCLRSAVMEFARGTPGEKLVVWLLTFSAALIATQALIIAGALDVSTARQLAARGSMSGAIIGGCLFGAGMILARGCVSRLLVLSAGGNLRALLSGLVMAVTAQASLSGILSPLRNEISGWWTVEGGARDLLPAFGVGHGAGLAFGLVWLAAGLAFAFRQERVRPWAVFGGLAVGTTIALGWWFTYQVSAQTLSAQAVPVQSLTFSGPSADILMLVLSPPGRPFDFNIGLVPGVFLGSFIAALLAKELLLEGFKDGQSMRRYIIGAVLMGFGSMLAGGCAVGAGITGASVFAVTAWATLFSMWVTAALVDWLVDRRGVAPAA